MSQPFLGQIEMFAFEFAPRGWMACNGQLLPIAQYPDLFDLFGNTFGGDGSTAFRLPNLGGRVPLYGSQYPLGVSGGRATHKLQGAEVATHSHAVMVDTNKGTLETPGVGAVLSTTNGIFPGGTFVMNIYGEVADTPTLIALDASTIGVTGIGDPHENMMPYLPVNFCVNVSAPDSIIPSHP
jgi:microcystin-dependent protein